VLVLDASLALSWFLPDERREWSLTLLERVSVDGAFVPALFRWEIQSGLIGAERANRIDSDDVDLAIETLRDLPIVVEAPGERVFAGSELHLARHYGLTPYDAAYLALAWMRRLPLATLDADLAHAARDLGIAIYGEPRR
jgi:predicted nucleic acid-binding protein